MNTRTLATLAALAAAAAGCVDNDGSVRMYGLCTPPTPTEAGICTLPAKCESLWGERLIGDVSNTGGLDGPLVWPVQMNNQRPSNADRAGGVETAYAMVEGFKLSYPTAPVGLPDQTVRAVPGEQTINPGGTTVLTIPFITPTVRTLLSVAALPAQLTVEVRAFGTYGDGSTFETGPLMVEATVCGGCSLGWDWCPTTEKPDLRAVCPQPFQSGVPLCVAPPTPVTP